jgi:hypothetical protein
VIAEATCETSGISIYTCNRCNASYTEEPAPLGHKFAAEWTCDTIAHWHVCTVCGSPDERINHAYDAPNDGNCDECGYVHFIRGDMDQDGDVDSDDSIYLLYHVLFKGEGYPIIQPADIDGNNKVNVNDAIYLLNSVIFGNTEYPLF